MNLEEVEMQRLHLTTRHELSKKQLHGVAAHSRLSFCEYTGGMMALDLDTFIMGMASERIIINKQWPRDWWQALRERWMPRWWLRRYPVKYDEIDIDEQKYAAVCPHIDLSGIDDTHIMWMAEHQPENREKKLMAYIIRNSTPALNLSPDAYLLIEELNEREDEI